MKDRDFNRCLRKWENSSRLYSSYGKQTDWDETKHYIEDETTSPILRRIFLECASGKPLTAIAEDLNNQGLHTVLERKFNINGLRYILKNRAYIGEYAYDDIVIPGGIPRLISDELSEEVQRRLELNKHVAVKQKKEMDEPRY